MDLFGLKRFKNKKYVDWVRGCNCRIHSNCNQPSVPHHQNNLLGQQGKGTKNDYLVIPMCDLAHKEYHNHPGTFWDKHCLNPWRLVIKLLITYIEEGRK